VADIYLSLLTSISLFPEREVGFPPSSNYVISTRSTSTQQEPRRHDSVFPEREVIPTRSTSTQQESRRRDSAFPERDVIPTRSTSTQHESRRRDSAFQEREVIHTQSASTPRLSPLSAAFAGIRMGNYAALHSFIVANPDIVSHTEIDSLIAEARAQERIGNVTYPQTFVHHALLLRRCKQLHPTEYAQYFKQLGDPGNDIRRDFIDSVKTVYETIKNQVGATVQQSHVRNPENQVRSMPLVV
jgi:hypothetical protein